MKTQWLQSFLKCSAVGFGLAVAAVAGAADLTGAGATFPYPVYSKWAEAYKAKTGVGLSIIADGRRDGSRLGSSARRK